MPLPPEAYALNMQRPILNLKSTRSIMSETTTSPPYYGKLRSVPHGHIHPQGWLGAYLQNMAKHLTGRLDECGYPFDTPGFATERIEMGKRHGAEWWPYEQVGYWVDGMVRCAQAIGDDALLEKADKQIRHVLENAGQDGFLGPEILRSNSKQDCRWGHVPFFRAMMARHDTAPELNIDEALARHFTGGTHEFGMGREPTNIEQMCWAYGETADPALLKKAVEVFEFFDEKGWVADCTLRALRSGRTQQIHGVTFNEFAKLPVILYLWTGKEEYLQAAITGYETLVRDHMLVSGVHSSEEYLEGKGTRACIEICDIADFTWSIGYLLQATGDVKYADWIERACLNAGTGAATGDFTGHQYFTCPNQLLATNNSCHAPMSAGSNRLQYRPNPNTECCSGNVHRIMPNYVARMWMSAGEGDVAALLYGPSRFSSKIGEQSVTITQDTEFPFEESIRFTIATEQPVSFTLRLRIPGWTEGAELFVNGEAVSDVLPVPGSFLPIKREFADGDRIELRLPMPLKTSAWGWGGVAIERGPLVYSLAIKENWVKQPVDNKSCEDLPPHFTLPESPWNYGMDLGTEDLASQVSFQKVQEVGETPWSSEHAPVELRVPVRLIGGWEPERHDYTVSGNPWHNKRSYLKGKFVYLPELPHPCLVRELASPNQETARFIPHGCAKLRMTILPHCPNGSGKNDFGGRNPQTFI